MNETVKSALFAERAKLATKVAAQERCATTAQQRLEAANAKLRLLRPRLADIEAHLTDAGIKLDGRAAQSSPNANPLALVR